VCSEGQAFISPFNSHTHCTLQTRPVLLLAFALLRSGPSTVCTTSLLQLLELREGSYLHGSITICVFISTALYFTTSLERRTRSINSVRSCNVQAGNGNTKRVSPQAQLTSKSKLELATASMTALSHVATKPRRSACKAVRFTCVL